MSAAIGGGERFSSTKGTWGAIEGRTLSTRELQDQCGRHALGGEMD